MKKALFFRCNGGHYFQGTNCPFDGWTMDGLAEAAGHFSRLEADGKDPRMTDLEAIHPSLELLRRMLVIEFGDDSAAFDALVPERYLYQGQELLWQDTGSSLN